MRCSFGIIDTPPVQQEIYLLIKVYHLFTIFWIVSTFSLPLQVDEVLGSIRGEVKVAAQNLVCGLLIDTFNIIITPFDLFGEGRYCYTFHARCDENPSLVLEDGATRIFLNTRGTNRNEVSEELIQFLEYMEQSTLNVAIPDTNGNLIKIHNYVRQVKASEEIGVKFMQ